MPNKPIKINKKIKRSLPVSTGSLVPVVTHVPWYKREISLSDIFHVSVTDIVLMSKHMSVMLQAGLTVPETLETLVDQGTGRLRAAMMRVHRRVVGGATLGDAMALEPAVFSPIFVSSVVIGENSGTLAENLSRLSIQMEKDLAIRRAVQSAMMYPSIVVTVALVLGFVIATFVLPQIVTVFDSLRVELPLPTRILIWIAGVFQHYGIILMPLTFGAIFSIISFLRAKFMRPITDRAILMIPIVESFAHDINRARFCRTVGTLLESGTPIQEALEITARAIPNSAYRASLRRMRDRIESGDTFADIIAYYPKLYPKVVARMVAVGERSGSLGSTLLYLAAFYEDRVENAAKNLASVLEPAMLIGIGGVVAFVAAAILTPIYSILSGL